MRVLHIIPGIGPFIETYDINNPDSVEACRLMMKLYVSQLIE